MLEQISEFQFAYQIFTKFQILTRVIVLLEEGLQMKSDAGYDQAISAIKIIRNYAKISGDRAVHELHNFGAIQTLAKSFFS